MEQLYWIKHMDPIESLMSPALSELVKTSISYPTVWYQQGAFRKIRQEGTKSTIISRNSKTGHTFFTGLIPRILRVAESKGIKVDYVPPSKYLSPPRTDIRLPEGIELRSFQNNLIEKIFVFERGVLKAPTGTGKTILGLSIIASMGYIDQVLWLCHTKDLLYQTAAEAEKFFGKKAIGLIGDGHKEADKFLTIATRQSFKDLADDLGTSYDVVIVDETHHISKFKSDYAEILHKVFAPIRIGLTATLSTDAEAKLAMEALIGPLIGEFTINEGIEQGMMAKIKIKIIKMPKLQRIRDLRKYPDVYEQGIVRRLDRNRIIIDLIKLYNQEKISCLVIVNQIAHGHLLMSMAKHCGLNTVFVYSNTDSEMRVETKQALNGFTIGSVIATTVWKEGINIPELGVVINAAGGKSEISTLQSIGRGTRKTATKEELIIVDFFDPSHPFLLDHWGERFCLYSDQGWI